MVEYRVETLKKLGIFFNEQEKIHNAFEGNIFPMKVMSDNTLEKTSLTPPKITIKRFSQGTVIKILTPTQMFQRLSIAIAQVNAVNTSENLINETRQIIYSLYRTEKNY